MRHTLSLAILLGYSISLLHSQTYNYKVIDDSGQQDTIMQLAWPSTTPSYYNNMLCFEEAARLRLHDIEINIPIKRQSVRNDQFIQHHQNVGIYYTPEKSTLNNAVLHEFGFAIDQMIFNPHQDGYYLVLTENNGRKSSTLYEVAKGVLIRHKTKICEARITAFPANGKTNRQE